MEDVRLGEVVRQVKRAEEPEPGTVYRQAGVDFGEKGAYERDTIDGADTKYKHFFRLREGDLMVNKIWARNGSVAVVPQELDGCYVSSEFPTFEADRSRVLPEWLHWIAKSPILWDQFDEKSFGTAARTGSNRSESSLPASPYPPSMISGTESVTSRRQYRSHAASKSACVLCL